jgi:sensor histidine kinase YesM
MLRTLIKPALILLLLFTTLTPIYGQSDLLHIDTRNGLPSNHVYSIIKDHLGYLWFATTDGVAKYNGYEIKTFNISNGLPNNDVWALFEDNKGRIWPHFIADEVGYLSSDKFHKVVIDEPDVHFYIRVFVNTTDGVRFLSGAYRNTNLILRLCDEKNDTVKSYKLFKNNKYDDTALLAEWMHVDGYALIVHDGLIKKITAVNKNLILDTLCTYPRYLIDNQKKIRLALFNDYVIGYNNGTELYTINTRTCEERIFHLSDDNTESIYTPFINNNRLYIATNKKIYKFNYDLQLDTTYILSDLIPYANDRNITATSYMTDSFWGEIIATTTHGAMVRRQKLLSKINDTLCQNHVYVGSSTDSCNYWWNATQKRLYIRSASPQNKLRTAKFNFSITKIIPYNKDKSMVIAQDSLYWYYPYTDKKENIFKHTKTFITDSQAWSHYTPEQYTKIVCMNVSSAMITDTHTIYTISKTGIFSRFTFCNDTVKINYITNQRLTGMLYDENRKIVWAYYDKIIMLYNALTGGKIQFSGNEFDKLGIKKIEKVLIDSFGNIFIKDYDRLIMYNPLRPEIVYLLKNSKLKDADVLLYKNKLVTYGGFGIAFHSALAPGIITLDTIYHNSKKICYDHIVTTYVRGDSIMLHTDNGTFRIPIPHNSNKTQFEKTNNIAYILLANNNIIKNAGTDTITIRQNDPLIQLDAINPNGTGQLRFMRKIKIADNKWEELDGNRLYANNIKPGAYYDLSLVVHDELWKSNVVHIALYAVPYWWQTPTGRKLILFASIILTIILIALTRHITKISLTKKHAKQSLKLELKNLNLALELKSIYAQINPHFIFNTLSTGLYFIKKKKIDEAYTHISSFSDLLRSYIKSSRSKYITVAEEVTNLTNYISLQQARFENKFDYHIIINNNLNAYTTSIPALLIQPLVENAISHGLLPDEDRKGTLTIEFKTGKNAGDLQCIIDDDGIGRKQSKLYHEKSKIKTESYGTDLIKELIAIFNKNENIHINLMYIDKTEPYRGTTVIITIEHQTHEQ